MYCYVLYGTEGLAFNNKYQTAQHWTWQHSEEPQDTELWIKRYKKRISAELRITDVTASVMKVIWHSDKKWGGFLIFCFYTYKRRVTKCKWCFSLYCQVKSVGRFQNEFDELQICVGEISNGCKTLKLLLTALIKRN
jgi:hypothetical protein